MEPQMALVGKLTGQILRNLVRALHLIQAMEFQMDLDGKIY
jgi:hypothetical protein